MSFHSLHGLTEARAVSTPVGPCDRRGRPLRWLMPVLVSFGVAACGEGSGALGSNPATSPPPEASTTGSAAPTQNLTSGETALTNLSSRIEGLRSAVTAQPTLAPLRGELVGNLLTRAQFVGSFADLGESLGLAADGRSVSSDVDGALEIEATALGAVHEFARATELLESIETAASDRTLGNLQLARGDDPRPIEQARRAQASENPGFESLTSWAVALSALGDFEAADAAYAEALRNYRDVSPLPVAWVAFQRGVMWAERAGDIQRGRRFYEQATIALPGYVVANVHLAEIEASEGDVAAARSRLLRLVEAGTEDPEPYGFLSEISVTESERDRLRGLTESRYLALIERYPKAFLDHGAEFFSTFKPAFALDLALENLENRTDDRAYQSALEAALAAAATAVACDLAWQATLEVYPGFVRPSVPLRELADEVLASCE